MLKPDCKDRRKSIFRLLNWFAFFWLTPPLVMERLFAKKSQAHQEAVVKLPLPASQGKVSVEQAIKQRRTIRSFISRALNLNQLAQLLWSASGITEGNGYKRAAPSAGALYPMDIYVVMGKDGVPPIEAGVYHYQPATHQLVKVMKGDVRFSVARASLSQMWMSKAPLTMVITAEYQRATGKYGKRGIKYALIEAGHIGQNIYLQAQALGLEAGLVGAFHDAEVIGAINIPSNHEPILLMPVGYPM
jgi:SagB-type dehydrogenase family enzyme